MEGPCYHARFDQNRHNSLEIYKQETNKQTYIHSSWHTNRAAKPSNYITGGRERYEPEESEVFCTVKLIKHYTVKAYGGEDV
jgi:hypothetical protein